jgi:hypothetical protein
MSLRRRGPLARAVFVNLELIEDAIPSVFDVEDRHVEYQQGIVHSPMSPDYLPPLVGEALL